MHYGSSGRRRATGLLPNEADAPGRGQTVLSGEPAALRLPRSLTPARGEAAHLLTGLAARAASRLLTRSVLKAAWGRSVGSCAGLRLLLRPSPAPGRAACPPSLSRASETEHCPNRGGRPLNDRTVDRLQPGNG